MRESAHKKIMHKMTHLALTSMTLAMLLAIGCSADERFSGVSDGGTGNGLTPNNQVNNQDAQQDTEEGNDNTNNIKPKTKISTDPKKTVIATTSNYTIKNAVASYDNANTTIKVKAIVIGSNKAPAQGIKVIFVMSTSDGSTTTSFDFNEVTTDAKGVAQASKSVDGVSIDTLKAWKFAAKLNGGNPVTIIKSTPLKMGGIYTYRWLNAGSCTTNVLRIKLNAQGYPVSWPNSITAGSDVKMIVLPTAESGKSCSIGYYKVAYDEKKLILAVSHAGINMLCDKTNGGSNCWRAHGNDFVRWQKGSNEAARGQQWLLHNHEGYAFYLAE